MLRSLLSTLVLLLLSVPGAGQRCGLMDTIPLNVFGTTAVSLNIDGYLNDGLGNSNQGLCGVSAYFRHSYVYGLTLTLVSPAGDSLLLVGPATDQTRPPSTLARWFVDFGSCDRPPAPDPGAPGIWDNTDAYNWPAFGTFRGIYHPAGGCLEELDSGPVNGEWKLVITNTRPGEQGVLSFLLLEFCDPAHVEGPCCFADAGTFTESDPIEACADPPSLPVSLLPRYQVPRPDPAEYGYAYTIADTTGIRWLQTDPNLAGFAAGTYEICGLSYREGELPAIPTDGSFTSDALRDNLLGSTPVACADLTPICRTAVLHPPPAATLIDEQLCRGGLYQVGSNIFTEDGDYTVVLPGAFGCDSLVELTLEFVDTLYETVDTTICAEAAYRLGDRLISEPGLYVGNLVSAFGCDSIVTLNLTVADPIASLETVAICAGEAYDLGDTLLTTSGLYERTLTAANGCDSTVSLDLLVLAPEIRYTPFRPQFDCLGDTVRIDASPSQLAFADDFGWYDEAGNLLRGALDITIRTPGIYVFVLTAATRGTSCTVTDTVRITDERFLLAAELGVHFDAVGAGAPVPCAGDGPCAVLDCRNPVIGLDAAVSPVRTSYTYAWSPSAGIVRGQDSSTVFVDQPGQYGLRITDALTGCTLDTFVVVSQDNQVPEAAISGNRTLTCTRTEIQLLADTIQDRLAELEFAWTGPCLPDTVRSPALSVACPGTYSLRVTNRVNGCFEETAVEVLQDIAPVDLRLAPASAPITCREPEQVLAPGPITAAHPLGYTWERAGDTVATTREFTAQQPGVYTFTATDRVNGCSAFGNITVPADTAAPVIPLGPEEVALNCYDTTAVLGRDPAAPDPALTYAWRNLNVGTDPVATTPTLTVGLPGSVYSRSVTNTDNGCTAVDTVRVFVDLQQPTVRLEPPLDFDCFIDTIFINSSNTIINFNARETWTGPCVGEPASDGQQPVRCPGTYTYELTNEDNGCTSSASVTVGLASTGVVAFLEDTVFLDCQTGTARLDRSRSSEAAFIRWFRDGERIRLFGEAPEVTVPGRYDLVLTNFNESCTDTASIMVMADCEALSIVIPPDSLTCLNQVVTLNAEHSLPGDAEEIRWLVPAGGVVREGANPRLLEVFSPGRYGFSIRNPVSGETDTSYVEVVRNQREPVADAGPRDTISCAVPEVVLDGSASSQGEFFEYAWITAGDDTLSNAITQEVGEPGTYLFSVTQRETGCRRVASVTVFDDTEPPLLSIEQTVIPCDTLNHPLVAIGSAPAPLRYEWVDRLSGDTLRGDTLLVSAPGSYVARVMREDNGCSATEFVDVEQAPCPPFPALADTTLTCERPSLTLRPVFRDGCADCDFRWRRNGQALPEARDSTLFIERSGMYTLTATNAFGLAGGLDVTVTDLRDVPTATAGPDRTLTCRVTEVLLVGKAPDPRFPFSFAWESMAGDTLPDGRERSYRATTTGDYILRTRNDSTGCVATDTVTVAVDTLRPVASAGDGRLLTCASKRRVLDATGSSLGRRYAYQWSGGPSVACLEGDTTLNPVVRCGGRYRLLVTDVENGCTATDTVSVATDDELPAIVPLPDTTLNCASPAIELTGGDTSGTFIDYDWRLSGTADPLPESAPATITVGEAGEYVFRLVNTRTGCENDFSVRVTTDFERPVVDAGLPDTFLCTLDSLLLSGEILGTPAPGLRYAWSSETGFAIDAADGLRPVVFQPDRYFFTVTNPRNQCSATDSVEVFRDVASPVVDAGVDPSITCARTQVQLNGGFSSESGDGTVSWTRPDGEPVNVPGILAPRVSDFGPYQLNITDPRNGCTGADVVVVLADTLPPAASINLPDSNVLNCYTPELRLAAALPTSPEALEYNWRRESFPFGTGGTLATTLAGSYTLTVRRSENGCTAEDTLSVFEDVALPRLSTRRPPALTCRTDSVVLSVVAPDPGITYEWLDLAGEVVSDGPELSVGEGGPVHLTGRLLRTGCRDTTTVVVPVNRIPPSVVIAAPPPLNCERTELILSGEGSSRGTAFVGAWTTPDGTVTDTSSTYTLPTDRPGVHLFSVTNLNNGCSATDSTAVVREATAITAFDFDLVEPTCPEINTGALFITGVEGGAGPFRYRIDGGLLTDRLVYDGLPLGTYSVEVVGQDGCALERTFTLTNTATASVDAGRDTLIALGDSLQLGYTTTFDRVASVFWSRDGRSFPDSLLSGGLLTVHPRTSGSYELTVVGADGCVASDAIFVEVDEEIDFYVPTAFSPNNDGRNDRLRPFLGKQASDLIAFSVHNRWGSELYHTREEEDLSREDWGWDGNVNGVPVKPQVVVWRLVFRLDDGTVVERRGEAVILR